MGRQLPVGTMSKPGFTCPPPLMLASPPANYFPSRNPAPTVCTPALELRLIAVNSNKVERVFDGHGAAVMGR